jgi:hypothetical protein
MPEISAVAPIKRYSPDDLLTPKEHAEVRRCSIRKLEDERAQRRGPGFLRDGNRIFYRWRDIEAYMQGIFRPTIPEPSRRGRPRKVSASTAAASPI